MLEDPPPGEGIRQVTVPRAMSGIRALTDAQAGRIAAMGRTIAERLGYDADIEGAMVGDEVMLFQARPITTLTGIEAITVEPSMDVTRRAIGAAERAI